MTKIPNEADLAHALSAAASAHHNYEQATLKGVRDVQWSGFYAAFALGRLGEFATPDVLVRLLEDAPSQGDWASKASRHVIRKLAG